MAIFAAAFCKPDHWKEFDERMKDFEESFDRRREEFVEEMKKNSRKTEN